MLQLTSLTKQKSYMNKNKAILFNEKASSTKAKADKVVDKLRIETGQNIADIGSGGGFFASKFSDKIGNSGNIFCMDINKEFLDFIDNQNIPQVQTVLYDGENLNFDDKSLDLIFMRNVTHHIENREKFFVKLKSKLKPNGKIAIIDYKKGFFLSFYSLFGHYMDKQILIEEMEKSGYVVDESFDFITNQHFIIFKQP